MFSGRRPVRVRQPAVGRGVRVPGAADQHRSRRAAGVGHQRQRRLLPQPVPAGPDGVVPVRHLQPGGGRRSGAVPVGCGDAAVRAEGARQRHQRHCRRGQFGDRASRGGAAGAGVDGQPARQRVPRGTRRRHPGGARGAAGLQRVLGVARGRRQPVLQGARRPSHRQRRAVPGSPRVSRRSSRTSTRCSLAAATWRATSRRLRRRRIRLRRGRSCVSLCTDGGQRAESRFTSVENTEIHVGSAGVHSTLTRAQGAKERVADAGDTARRGRRVLWSGILTAAIWLWTRSQGGVHSGRGAALTSTMLWARRRSQRRQRRVKRTASCA